MTAVKDLAAGTRVLLLEGIHPDAKTAFEAVGCQVTSLERALDEDELAEANRRGHEASFVASGSPLHAS